MGETWGWLFARGLSANRSCAKMTWTPGVGVGVIAGSIHECNWAFPFALFAAAYSSRSNGFLISTVASAKLEV